MGTARNGVEGADMTDTTLSLRVSPALHGRLEALAERTGRSLEDTLRAALEESVERWEDHLRDCDALESGAEPRTMLHVVNE